MDGPEETRPRDTIQVQDSPPARRIDWKSFHQVQETYLRHWDDGAMLLN
jgi:hypothetical protein